MTNVRCPSCGSDTVEIKNLSETRQLTLGPEFSYMVPTHVCESCGEEGDFNGSGDSFRENAIQLARKELASNLIEGIHDIGLKLSHVERALELPQRTISSKWRTGISASGLALLRIIRTMPWIVNIADNKFTKESIGNEIMNVMQNRGVTVETATGPENKVCIKIIRAETKAVRNSGVTINFDPDLTFASTGTT